jgi:opacity protein-like surface antigen
MLTNCKNISLAALITLGTLFTLSSIASAKIPSLRANQTIAQATQEQLDRQREAEKVLKQGENLRQDIREQNNYDYNRTDLDNKATEQINRVRESGSDPQTVRDAQAELNRVRDDNNRRPTYYRDPFFPAYYSAPIIIYSPLYSSEPIQSAPAPAQQPIGQTNDNNAPSAEPQRTPIWTAAAFKDGSISPSIGVKVGNSIGVEVAGIFNQDSLPGGVNNFSLPSNFFANNLGVKKLSPQIGGDVVGFMDVAPQVAAYASIGVYFQNIGRIAQSQATNELYKQTDETNVSGAVGAGAIYSLSEDASIGLGYHSLRGATVRVGVNF